MDLVSRLVLKKKTTMSRPIPGGSILPVKPEDDGDDGPSSSKMLDVLGLQVLLEREERTDRIPGFVVVRSLGLHVRRRRPSGGSKAPDSVVSGLVILQVVEGDCSW